MDTMQALQDPTIRKILQTQTKTRSTKKKYIGIWDFNAHVDRKIDANWPNKMIRDFKEWTCTMLDVTAPADKNISLNEFDKLSKYKHLEIEMTKMWKLKTKTIQFVIDPLGMMKKRTQNYIDEIPGKPSLQEIQNIVLTSTTHILSKIISM